MRSDVPLDYDVYGDQIGPMRWTLVFLAVGCGGSNTDCRQAAAHAFTATREVVSAASCNDLPATLVVTLAVESGAWTFTESGVPAFAATYVDPKDGCYGYALHDDPYHDYYVWMDGHDQSFVDVVRVGYCTARYLLR